MISEKCLNLEIKSNYTLSNSLNGHYSICENLKYGLNEDECLIISAYTGQISKWINKELKVNGINDCGCKEEVKHYLNSGLNKMPSYNKKVVFHLSDVNDDLMKILSINVDKFVRFPTFLSSSKNKKGDSKKLVLQIETSNKSKAVDICKYNPSEEEVLFNSGSCFKVISLNDKEVILKEIDYDSFEGKVNVITSTEISKIIT